jgi:FkbM family methyltransferase
MMERLRRFLFSSWEAPWLQAAARSLNQAVRFPQPREVRIDGLRLYAHSLDRLVALYLCKFTSYNRGHLRLFRRLVKPGMVVVDVGSNLGFHTFCLARLVGPKGTVHALEPDPRNFHCLELGVRANRLDNVRAARLAVADSCGERTLFLSAAHGGDHRLYPTPSPRAGLKVPTVTLDHYLNGQAVDLVKLDIEGGEYQALRGMRSLVRRNPRLVVLCEFSPYLLQQAGASAEMFLQEMEDLGLVAELVAEEGTTHPVSHEALLYSLGPHQWVDLLLRRRDQLQAQR